MVSVRQPATALPRDYFDFLRSEGRCSFCDRQGKAVCSVLSCEELERLDSIMEEKTLAPGGTLFTEGDDLAFFFTVREGALRAVRLLPDGRRSVLDFLFAGDFLGLNAKGRYPYTAEAIAETALCCFPRPKFMALSAGMPKMMARLLGLFQGKAIASQNRNADLARKTPPERLAAFLVEMARRCGAKKAAGTLRLPMSRADIADYLGLTVETVSRTFTRFKTDGLIALDNPGRVRLKNEAALKVLAEGETGAWRSPLT